MEREARRAPRLAVTEAVPLDAVGVRVRLAPFGTVRTGPAASQAAVWPVTSVPYWSYTLAV